MLNYISKNRSATIIQSLWRGYICRRNPIFFINNIVIKNIRKNNIQHNELFIKCMKIMKKYNPSKNEYKFIYGNLIQKSLINFLDSIFYSCSDLDKLIENGSQYKVDCQLKITSHVNFFISIKAKKNKNGKIIIINKNSNNKNYDLKNLITFIVILETKDIIVVPHNIVPYEYIENNDANICYKSSLITFFYKNKTRYIIHLKQNKNFINFIKNDFEKIKLHDIYEELYNEL